jgi:hypothetical protein
MPNRPPPTELKARQVLSQYGARSPTLVVSIVARFRTAPRASEGGVSLIAGRLTPRQAAMIVRHEYLPVRDSVRYTTVGRLREAGFRVRSTPTRMNPDHVSVEYDGVWTDDGDVSKRFDDCFDQPVWGDGDHG